MEYILYGAIRSRTMRELTEYYIKQQGGDILFYVDDNVPRYKVSYPLKGATEIKKYPQATVVLMNQGAGTLINKLRGEGIRNKLVTAPLLAYRFICDKYQTPQDMLMRTKKWIAAHEAELRSIYCMDDEMTEKLLEEIISEKKAFRFLNEDWVCSYGRYNAYFYDLSCAGGGKCFL